MTLNSNGNNNYDSYYLQQRTASLTSLPTITDSISQSSATTSGLMPGSRDRLRAGWHQGARAAGRSSPSSSRWGHSEWSAPSRQHPIGRPELMMHLLSICMAIVYFTSSFIQETVPTREICPNINMKAILLPIYGETCLEKPFLHIKRN